MTVSNFRVVLAGAAYRSGELHRFDPATDRDVVAAGLKTVVDLRTQAERRTADLPIPGAVTIVADVLADHPSASSAQLPQLLAEPEKLRQVLAEHNVVEQLQQVYRELVMLGSARASYRTLLQTIADPANRPVLFHCTAGKDRTGWGAAVLQMIQGVAEDQVLADYLASNGPVTETFAPVLERFKAKGGDPELILPVLRVQESFLQAAMQAMRESYGDLDGYLSKGLELNQSEIDSLREAGR